VFFPIVPIAGTVLWYPPTSMAVVVRTSLDDPTAIVPAVRRVLTEMDPAVPLGTVEPMSRVVAKSIARTSFTMLLLGVAAGMALLLSAIGIYGVISYVVGQRRGEIGIRMALGAPVAQVRRLVVVQSLRLAAIGVVLGLGAALASTRVLASLLFEVSPTDARVLAVVALLLVGLAALASYAPARRASRVNPAEALRAE
jgi:ABC-type antimicrobial peptide transport system permease subunit